MKDVLMHLGTAMRDDLQTSFNRSYQNQHMSNENLDQNSNGKLPEKNILALSRCNGSSLGSAFFLNIWQVIDCSCSGCLLYTRFPL